MKVDIQSYVIITFDEVSLVGTYLQSQRKSRSTQNIAISTQTFIFHWNLDKNPLS